MRLFITYCVKSLPQHRQGHIGALRHSRSQKSKHFDSTGLLSLCVYLIDSTVVLKDTVDVVGAGIEVIVEEVIQTALFHLCVIRVEVLGANTWLRLIDIGQLVDTGVGDAELRVVDRQLTGRWTIAIITLLCDNAGQNVGRERQHRTVAGQLTIAFALHKIADTLTTLAAGGGGTGYIALIVDTGRALCALLKETLALAGQNRLRARVAVLTEWRGALVEQCLIAEGGTLGT